MRKGSLFPVLLFALLVAFPAEAQRCEHSRDIDLTADPAGLDLALIIAEAGELRVDGSGGSRVAITGRACASSASRLDELEVDVTTRGSRLEITAETPDNNWSWFGSRYAYIDLEVSVPADLAVEIEDGSGNIVITGIHSVMVDDGSGNIEISSVAADVDVEDGSGNLRLEGIGGMATVDDGSGNITIRDARDVTIDDDGSGNIDIEDVSGSVLIWEDGSGTIRVRDVNGDFTVHSDGSGGIRHTGVGGTVDIPDRR